ncbi:hypothetical protein [Enterococcus gallinarum]|uniref:hypothetical protein n=1 Tax=Enterococcus gallinarum TaxID=1353 RepID=UPI0013C21431|nr:hypothetical protein [Enterococcus gallinarum]MUO33715.1 hypothetical protein [Enterococcus gallinarum]
MSKLNLILAGSGFVLCILSMYLLPFFMDDIVSGVIGFIGIAMSAFSIYLMRKEKR